MFEIVPFKKEHLEPLMLQKINSYLPEWVRKGHASEMEKAGAITIMVNGEITVCGGVTKVWEGRGQIWSIFSETCKSNFLPTFRAIRSYLDSVPLNRIEMSVPCDFELGHRRAKLLGFKLECACAEKYLANGTDCSLYARVK